MTEGKNSNLCLPVTDICSFFVFLLFQRWFLGNNRKSCSMYSKAYTQWMICMSLHWDLSSVGVGPANECNWKCEVRCNQNVCNQPMVQHFSGCGWKQGTKTTGARVSWCSALEVGLQEPQAAFTHQSPCSRQTFCYDPGWGFLCFVLFIWWISRWAVKDGKTMRRE